MSPIRLKKYLPELAICAVALIPLAMGACTFKLGEPVRLYDSREPAPAPKPAPSVSAGGISDAAAAAGKTVVKAPTCTFQGNAPLENNQNLSTLDALKLEVEAESAGIHDESGIRDKITQYATTLGILDKKPELRTLYNDIISMPAIAPRAPIATPSGRPNDLPVVSNPFSGAITAFVIHKHVFELAIRPANQEGGLGMADDKAKAKALADMLYKLPLETLAALEQALAFAKDKTKGLGLELKPALAFCNKILKTPTPAQTIIAYINTFQRELLLTGVADKAREEAEKITCLAPKK